MQHEIKCPNCQKIFTIDEASYAEIQKQVHNAEFDKELETRIHALEENAKKDTELAKKETAETLNKTIGDKNAEIADLKSKLDNAETAKQLAVSEATSKLEREVENYKNELKFQEMKTESTITNIKNQYEAEIRNKDELVAYYKDLKQKMSTKMIGETLEQHCEIEFNKIRATGFKNAYFEKDNDARTGSKGDFIYRETDDSGTEIISIMFEMKNENETTATKHKNEHFFKELDKDRREKKCEYAVLVSLLESDNEFYNAGIVDVSYQSGFEKMYVVRPQCFIPIITILRNAALNNLAVKRQLVEARNQSVDVTNFEEKLNEFKNSFTTNSERATKNFNKAIEDIDKSIKNLEDTKRALILTVQNFDVANKKLDDLTVKRLARGNETMTQLFNNLENHI